MLVDFVVNEVGGGFNGVVGLIYVCIE